MKQLVLLLGGVSAFAQSHPYSNAWSYYTSAVTSDAQFTATTVAGTGGTATHTMNTIAVFVQSPNGRTNAAYDYPSGTTGQATTYLSLCGGGACEDGQFFVSTTGTNELCGQTGQILALAAQSGDTAVAPWVRWRTPTSGQLGSSSIARTNGSVIYTGLLDKSTNCPGVSDISCIVSLNPSGISLTFEPNSSLPASFIGNSGTVQWTLKTTAANNLSGTALVGAGINATSCTVNGAYGANTVSLTVD
jgi:hypothetical protein